MCLVVLPAGPFAECIAVQLYCCRSLKPTELTPTLTLEGEIFRPLNITVCPQTSHLPTGRNFTLSLNIKQLQQPGKQHIVLVLPVFLIFQEAYSRAGRCDHRWLSSVQKWEGVSLEQMYCSQHSAVNFGEQDLGRCSTRPGIGSEAAAGHSEIIMLDLPTLSLRPDC